MSVRFPDYEEFKQNLLSNVNASYARVLLLKIEEYETRNIPVDVDCFIEPMQIVGTEYYCEGCLSNNRARVCAKQ
jgi:hypothetical protein